MQVGAFRVAAALPARGTGRGAALSPLLRVVTTRARDVVTRSDPVRLRDGARALRSRPWCQSRLWARRCCPFCRSAWCVSHSEIGAFHTRFMSRNEIDRVMASRSSFRRLRPRERSDSERYSRVCSVMMCTSLAKQGKWLENLIGKPSFGPERFARRIRVTTGRVMLSCSRLRCARGTGRGASLSPLLRVACDNGGA